MQQNHSISRYKQKLLLFLSALFIALILQPTQTVYIAALAYLKPPKHSNIINIKPNKPAEHSTKFRGEKF